MDFLERMYASSRRRAAALTPEICPDPQPVRPFGLVLHGMAVIAEVKYASPSQGDLGVRQGPSELARAYEALGASAVSCLTEPEFFKGSLAFLAQVRAACGLPVLMKDFVTDERQIAAGRQAGADAVLLITEMLSSDELARLYRAARSLGMDCLVEVHGARGLMKARDLGAEIIGVNARDLSTLRVDPERHEEMAGLLPTGVIRVAESGITSRKRLIELKGLGYDAALIGRAVAVGGGRKEIFGCG